MFKYSNIPEVEDCLNEIENTKLLSGPFQRRVHIEKLTADLYKIARNHSNELIRIYKEGLFGPAQLIWPLRGLSEKNVIDFLTDLVLNDKEVENRLTAIMVLSEVETVDLVDTFVRVLKDENSSVQFDAVTYLESHGDKRALSGLKEIIKDKKLQLSSPGLIDSAKRTIDRLEKS